MKRLILRLSWIHLAIPIAMTWAPVTHASQLETNTFPPITTSAPLSPWSSQVLTLSQAGIDESVMLAYVETAGTFNLTAEQIIALTHGGVPGVVITSMIEHDAEIISGQRAVIASTAPGPSPLQFLPAGPPISTATFANVPNLPAGENAGEIEPEFSPYEWGPPEEIQYAQERSPVRKPYAEKLLDPIIVFRAYSRPANVQFLQSFP